MKKNIEFEIFEMEMKIAGESEYQGKKVTLNKPFRTPEGPKKFSVYVKNDKGNVVKVNFGDPNMEIRRDNDDARKNFRSRHQCDVDSGPKWKAKYWSCKMWEKGFSVTDVLNKKSFEKISGDNEPTNPSLWEKVQKLTKGEVKSIKHNGKEINGPNDGKGFEIFPSAYANGWASKTYKELGGGWKKKSSLSDLKKSLTIGSKWSCFNHILNKDLGVREVSKIQSKSVAFKVPDAKSSWLGESWLEFPKASEIKFNDDGGFTIVKGGKPLLTYKKAD